MRVGALIILNLFIRILLQEISVPIVNLARACELVTNILS